MRSLSSESDSVLSIAVTSGPYSVWFSPVTFALHEASHSIYITRHMAEARRRDRVRCSKGGVVK
jgi:hypothetical protein